MEYDSNLLGTYATVGMVAGIVLLIAGVLAYIFERPPAGTRQEWILFGGLSVPAAWFFAFPLSNRDHPLAWLLLMMFMYGAGLGIGLALAALPPRRRRD